MPTKMGTAHITSKEYGEKCEQFAVNFGAKNEEAGQEMVKILQLTLRQIARLVEGSVFQHPQIANYANCANCAYLQALFR